MNHIHELLREKVREEYDLTKDLAIIPADLLKRTREELVRLKKAWQEAPEGDQKEDFFVEIETITIDVQDLLEHRAHKLLLHVYQCAIDGRTPDRAGMMSQEAIAFNQMLERLNWCLEEGYKGAGVRP